MMESLNLPACTFNFQNRNGKLYVFDENRKKFVLLTPEEWVRQHLVSYLIKFKKYPSGLISLEKAFLQNKINRRCDIVVHNRSGAAIMIIECKAPQVEISQLVFDQAVSYNFEVNAAVLVVSNGLKHFCFRKDKDLNKWVFLENIPDYSDLETLGI